MKIVKLLNRIIIKIYYLKLSKNLSPSISMYLIDLQKNSFQY